MIFNTKLFNAGLFAEVEVGQTANVQVQAQATLTTQSELLHSVGCSTEAQCIVQVVGDIANIYTSALVEATSQVLNIFSNVWATTSSSTIAQGAGVTVEAFAQPYVVSSVEVQAQAGVEVQATAGGLVGITAPAQASIVVSPQQVQIQTSNTVEAQSAQVALEASLYGGISVHTQIDAQTQILASTTIQTDSSVIAQGWVQVLANAEAQMSLNVTLESTDVTIDAIAGAGTGVGAQILTAVIEAVAQADKMAETFVNINPAQLSVTSAFGLTRYKTMYKSKIEDRKTYKSKVENRKTYKSKIEKKRYRSVIEVE